MRVSQRFPIAVHSLLLIAVLGPQQRATSTQVAASTGTNAVTIRNLFITLKNCHLIETLPGKNGGVRLTKQPEEITLWDVYTAVESDDIDEIFQFHSGSDVCPVGKNIYQTMKGHMSDAVNAMKTELDAVTLQTLLVELSCIIFCKDGTEKVMDCRQCPGQVSKLKSLYSGDFSCSQYTDTDGK